MPTLAMIEYLDGGDVDYLYEQVLAARDKWKARHKSLIRQESGT